MRSTACRAARPGRLHAPRRPRRRRKRAGRPGLGGQGPDPRRRPRQGRRRQARELGRRGPPAAGQMLGMTLVTHQTGPEGRQVKRVYVEEGCDIARELYLGAADRPRGLAGRPSWPRPKAAWRSRRSRPRRPRRSSGSRSTRRPASSRSTAARSPSGSASRASRSAKAVGFVRGALPGVHRARRQPGRDQPAGRDRRAATWSRSTPR